MICDQTIEFPGESEWAESLHWINDRRRRILLVGCDLRQPALAGDIFRSRRLRFPYKFDEIWRY